MKTYGVYERPTYWNWVRSEAALINTDGCSGVFGLRIDCCFEHDLGYYHATDPHDAYYRWRGGALDHWRDAKPITKKEVDARFRRCHQNRSKFGRYSPMAFIRWVGVSVDWRKVGINKGGQIAWDGHRERERAATV